MAKKRILQQYEIEEIIQKAEICYLAINSGKAPYVIPMNYGYIDKSLYLHTGLHGKKLDLIRRDNNVAFCINGDNQLVAGEKACGWSVKGKSVTGYGRAILISNSDEKIKALDIIMSHYTSGPFDYNPKSVEVTMIIRIDIEEMTGKSIE